MASPGGREADRVSVRVVPDTSRFAADLRTALERAEAALRVTIPVTPDMDGFTTEVRARLATLRDETIHVRVDADRDGLDGVRASLAALGRDSASAGGPLGAVARSLGNVRALALTAVPNIAGLAGGLAQMAPAAGVAATGLIAVASAGAAIKIGMSGVADALQGDAEAMAKLAPSARAFVTEVRSLAPAWDALRSSVQGALFDGLARSVQRLGSSVLPVLRTQLTGTAGVLNTMAKGVANAAVELADSGTLGRAMSSANAGLRNLAGAPGGVVRALGQIAAAAGPSFERITSGAASAGRGIAEKLNKAFESGALQRAIERAVSLVGQLFNTLGNLGTAVGNIFGPAADAGAGFLGVLNQVSRTLADVTGSAQAQEAFRGLFETLATAGNVVGGVLSTALRAVVPLLNTLVTGLAGPLQQALTTLAPVLQQIVAALGTALVPIIAALTAHIGQNLPILTQLITMLGQTLVPVLTALGPVLTQLVTTLSAALQPILAQLPALLAPLLALLAQLLPMIVQLAAQFMTALGPALIQITTALGQLLAALAPLLTALGQLLGGVLRALMPILTAIIGVIGRLAAVLAGALAAVVRGVVVPALRIVTALLRGDFAGAWNGARALVGRVGAFFRSVFIRLGTWAAQGVGRAVAWLASLPGRAVAAAASLGGRLRALMASAWRTATAAIRAGITSAISAIRGLPRHAKSALGNLGSVLVNAGKSLIRGFINGIKSMFGSVRGTLGSLTDMLPDVKGPPEKDARILRPAGRLVMAGFSAGITDAMPALRAQLQSVTNQVAAYRPALGAQVEAANAGVLGGTSADGGPVVSIGTFVAEERQTPASIARELSWLAKGRG
ncbi:phage tail protein [Streptomyces boncukensis]|uniref:Phage-related protein n=1 Tax=Streptomyces boncukensis TaxID=2711219 RepID=A0A6G4X1S1_9ACTN|nr:hypothetical protein [Streptomyces boncukensis]NGO71445.1 hypothetical protein [Streptomyces boncukensis]